MEVTKRIKNALKRTIVQRGSLINFDSSFKSDTKTVDAESGTLIINEKIVEEIAL